MTRGNQRDLAREKAAKKQQDKSKGQRKDGLRELTPAQRHERDAAALAAKKAKKDAEGNA